ncbi:serine/threonine-protein kinase TNNI3K-like [Parasteatoda tepidariorum]|uniref:serine/threonine-protein kinase TNNI3K-like n=1 Tax=Parasteatoda tepidariorum TaxID=114398 RepID=UPI0039BD7E21
MTLALLDHNFTVEVEDQFLGWRPLRYADKRGHWKIVDLLLKHGSNPDDMKKYLINAFDYKKQTPLHYAVNKAIAELLIKSGADIEVKGSWDETPLFSAKSKDVVEDKFGRTVLHLAAAYGYLNIVKLLLDSGFSADARDIFDWTPSRYADKFEHKEIAELLKSFS